MPILSMYFSVIKLYLSDTLINLLCVVKLPKAILLDMVVCSFFQEKLLKPHVPLAKFAKKGHSLCS